MNTSRTRRTRMRIGAVVAAVTAIASLAACSSGSNSGGGGGSSDTILIGSMFPPGTLDPTTGTQGSDLAYLDFVFDRLIQQNPQTGVLEPMLATSWKYVGADKLDLQVNLRQGVKFQDGTPFNAQAVVDYSKAFIKAGNIANLLQYVTDVTASGQYQVDYHLSQQNAHLPEGLAGRAGMIPSPAAVQKEGKNFGTHPVGTGPYSFVSETQGASYKFTRFDGYWDNANLKRVKNVEFKIFQTDTALVNGIRSGAVNVAFHLASQDVKTLKGMSNLSVSVGPGTQFGLTYFNSSRKPFDNPKVRLAYNLALDRKSIMEAVTDGLGQVTTQPVPKGTIGYVKSQEPVFSYNPAKAKQLMQEAGYGNGTNITCYEYPGLGFETAAPIMIAEEKAIGINMKIIPGTPAQVGTFFTNKANPVCFLANYGGADAATAFQLLWSQSYYNAGKTNYGIDDDYAKFYQTYTDAGIEQIAKDINASQATNPGYAPMFTAPLVNVYQKDIAGWVTSNLGIDNWRGMHYKS
ncbi:MAG TPA: ABC transporter substrate-binding protein [Jatrophihabitantaceae bacterium]|nr:ABC transporter substrate-binding protein [Jatrophihabitantaceae bacterium]